MLALVLVIGLALGAAVGWWARGYLSAAEAAVAAPDEPVAERAAQRAEVVAVEAETCVSTLLCAQCGEPVPQHTVKFHTGDYLHPGCKAAFVEGR